MPNLGINIPTAHLGYLHYFGNHLPHVKPEESAVTKRPNHVMLPELLRKFILRLGRLIMPEHCLWPDYRLFHPAATGEIGADLFYDESIFKNSNRITRENISESDNVRPGIYGAFQVATGKLGLMFNMGFILIPGGKVMGILPSHLFPILYQQFPCLHEFKNTLRESRRKSNGDSDGNLVNVKRSHDRILKNNISFFKGKSIRVIALFCTHFLFSTCKKITWWIASQAPEKKYPNTVQQDGLAM